MVLMMAMAIVLVTHLPSRLTSPLVQSFGFVPAAEGFVLLPAYMGPASANTPQARSVFYN